MRTTPDNSEPRHPAERSHSVKLDGATPGLLVGTRRVLQRGPSDFRVVCASCERGGAKLYRTREAANDRAVASSANPCRLCGAQ